MDRPRPKGGFYIGVTCPGCGGDLELEENFFVLTCRFCGSVLRVQKPKVPAAYLVKSSKTISEIRFAADRYLKEKGLALLKASDEIEPLLFPYWKIDAVILKVRNKVVERYGYTEENSEQEVKYEQKLTDISLSPYSVTVSASQDKDRLPYTLGMRTDYIRLEPFSEENIPEDFTVIPVTRPESEALQDIEKGAERLTNINPASFGKNRTRLFHPVAAIVYFPFYSIRGQVSGKQREIIVDGLTGRVAALRDMDDDSTAVTPTVPSQTEFGRLTVSLHRCATCGVDLPARQSYLYVCHNCHEITSLEDNPHLLQGIKATVGYDQSPDKLIPFWVFKMSEGQAPILKTLFGGIYASEFLVVPGFRVKNFEAFFRLAQRMSTASVKFEFIPAEGFQARFEPVTLSLTEAMTLADIVIYRAETGRRGGTETGMMTFMPSEISLVYLPFHPENYFYVDSVIGAITFEKTLVG